MGGRKRRLWLVQTELTVWNVPLPPKNAPASRRYAEAGEFTGYHLKIFRKQSKETGKNSQFRPILKAFDYTTAALRQVGRSPHSSWDSGWRWTAHKGGNEEEAEAFSLDTSYSHFPPNPPTPQLQEQKRMSDCLIFGFSGGYSTILEKSLILTVLKSELRPANTFVEKPCGGKHLWESH